MANMQVHQFGCLSDNYGYLLHDADTGETAAIDTPDAGKILSEAAAKGWTITQIWNTHWHPDHAGGNEKIKAETGCTIYGPRNEASKIPGIDVEVGQDDTVSLGGLTAQVIDVPGHTAGHIAYYLPAVGIAFVGDTLFALGCGRLFEGSPDQMWTSLSKLAVLPNDTTVYCAHEYTQANARFAETIEPSNTDLQNYIEEIDRKRADGLPTVPTTIGRELAANPFLRANDSALQVAMGHPGDTVATFAEIRSRKDNF